MKKVALLFGIILALLLVFCSCDDTPEQSSSEVKMTVTVEYVAQQGGYIDGQSVQTSEVSLGSSAQTSPVTARASEGYRFVGWSDGKTEATRFDVVSRGATFTAKFEKIQKYTVKYEAGEGGEIGGIETQTLEAGMTTQEVSAIPILDYRFVAWSDGVTDPTRSDIADENKTITAIFSNKLTAEYLSTEGGYVLGSVSQELAQGEKTSEVTAVAITGYTFVGWSDGNKKATRSDFVMESFQYTAVFKRLYTLELSCDTSRGEIEGTLIQKVADGEQSLTVKAKPKTGYDFVCWSNGETSAEITFTVTKNEKITACFVPESSGLSVVTIDTETGKDVTSKETYIGCTVTVYDKLGTYHVIEQTGQIRGRGNSTWTQKFGKNPYKIKFDSKQNVFGFGKAKDWVLLADYIDKSLLRNNLAYTVGGKRSALEASPDCRAVEVYLNGSYHGVYLLCEQVEIGKNRVNVQQDVTALDTSYLLEMDGWAYQTPKTRIYVPDNLESGRQYTVKSPNDEELTEAHKTFITNYLIDCINAAQGSDYDKVLEYIDVKSFAQAYIVFELFKNPDVDYSSVFMYRDVSDGKLYCGPLWDFDMSVGNVNHKGNVNKNPESLYVSVENPWFKALLAHDEFRELVAKELYENEDIIRETIEAELDKAYEAQDAYEKNFERWQVMGVNTWTNPSYIVAITTWEGQVEYCRDYLDKSLDYLIETYPYTPPSESE